MNDPVQAYGEALLDDPERIGAVNALGLDETLFVRRGERRRKNWSTSIVDVRRGLLLDMIEGRDAAPSSRGWPDARKRGWTGSSGPRLTCQGRIARCSTRCSRPLGRSRTRSI